MSDDAPAPPTATDLMLALDRWLDPNHGPSGYERTLFERCRALIDQQRRTIHALHDRLERFQPAPGVLPDERRP
jgi:hypothetical protein